MPKKALVLVAANRLPTVISCLKEAGYRLTSVEDAEEGRAILTAGAYDLVLFELQPELGFATCIESVRNLTDAPVFVLVNSTSYSEVEPILALANEAMLTSFDPKELMVRAKALGKHPQKSLRLEDNCLCFGDLLIFPGRRAVICNRRPIKLTPTEYAILMLLAEHPGQVFSQEQIHNAIRNDFADINVDKTISNHVGRLRNKLNKATRQKHIFVEWAIGYHFEP